MLKNMEITVTSVADINMRDYPDFCDAFIEEAHYSDGTYLTEEELDELNQDSDRVYAEVQRVLY